MSGREAFGSLLRRYRMSAGLSQEALAGRAGLSRRGIADLERGARRFPYPDTARRLSAALQLAGDHRAEFMGACRPAENHGAATRFKLQAEPSPLVGRVRELAELAVLLAGTRVLTLTGLGGIGKTRLALELAWRAELEHADGAVAVDLATTHDAPEVAGAVAASLGLTAAAGESTTDHLVRHLSTRDLLLILDNCEQPIGACAQLADRLVRGTSAVRLVVTSREALRVGGETVWAVPPLAHEESVALLVGRARAAAAATVIMTTAEIQVTGEICRRLEGIPLAIELAAARVPALGVGHVADLLDDRLGLLARGSRLEPPRHHTLRATLDWS